MSTKLNAEELAAKWIEDPRPVMMNYGTVDEWKMDDELWRHTRDTYAAAIREVAQPIADQRDELLQIVMDIMATPVPDASYHWLSDNGFTDRINAIVDKCTPKP